VDGAPPGSQGQTENGICKLLGLRTALLNAPANRRAQVRVPGERAQAREGLESPGQGAWREGPGEGGPEEAGRAGGPLGKARDGVSAAPSPQGCAGVYPVGGGSKMQDG